MKKSLVWVWVIALYCLCTGGLLAQQPDSGSATSANNLPAASQPVPRLILFSGTLKDLAGNPLTGPMDLNFAIYKQQTDGEPLWQESQTLNLDEQGHYAVLLGATHPQGLPVELFTSGEARWLGVAAGKLSEQPRTMLVSVPYALEANDAQMLGGKPASAFMLAPQGATNGTTTISGTLPVAVETTPATPSSAKEAPQAMPVGGTANYLAGWVNSSTLGASAIYQNPTTSYIGIGTTSPTQPLEVVSHGGDNGTYISVGDFVGPDFYGFSQESLQLRNPNYLSGAGQEVFSVGAEGYLSNAGAMTQSDLYIWDDKAAPGGAEKAVFQSGAGKIAFGNAITDSVALTGATFVIDSTGKTGIGTITPAHTLDVVGDIHASTNVISGGTVTATSFSGSGASLTNVNASALSGTDANAVTFSNASNSFTGSGAGLTGTAAGLSIGGNAATATTAANSTELGGVLASKYARLDIGNNFTGNQTVTGGKLGVGTSSPAQELDIVSNGGDNGTYIAVGDFVGSDLYGFSQTSLQIRNPNYLRGAGQEIFSIGAEGYLSNAGAMTQSDLYIWDDKAAPGGAEKAVFQSGAGKIAFGNAITDSVALTGATFVIDSTGKTGIGTAAPATALQVVGDVRVGTSGTNGCLQNFAGTALAGTCSSDARLKTNIQSFSPVLTRLAQLQPVHFNWKTAAYPEFHFGSGTNSGLIAQEVENVFPELVSVDAKGFKQVNYSELPYLMLQAIRELKTENDRLRAEKDEVQRQIATLEARLAQIEARAAKP